MASTGEDATKTAGLTGPRDGATLMRLATYASVAVALVLIAAKAGALFVTGSLALLSSLVDSLMDAVASVVNLFAVRHALVPPDREHRFGHGKAESLAALGQAALIAGSAVFLLWQTGERFVNPIPRWVAAWMSMLSTPAPARPITRRFFPASMMAAVTCDALLTTIPA